MKNLTLFMATLGISLVILGIAGVSASFKNVQAQTTTRIIVPYNASSYSKAIPGAVVLSGRVDTDNLVQQIIDSLLATGGDVEQNEGDIEGIGFSVRSGYWRNQVTYHGQGLASRYWLQDDNSTVKIEVGGRLWDMTIWANIAPDFTGTALKVVGANSFSNVSKIWDKLYIRNGSGNGTQTGTGVLLEAIGYTSDKYISLSSF